MSRAVAIFILLAVLLPSAFSRAQAPGWKIVLKDQAGATQEARVGIAVIEEQGRRLIAIDLLSPWGNVTSVTESDDAGGANPVQIVTKPNGRHLYLTSANGSLSIQNNGAVSNVSYQLQPNTAPLKLDPSCRRAGLKPKAMTATPSRFPAVLSCSGPKSALQPTEIIFSSLRDAEWLGTDAFETSGKGERFKTFSFGDTSSLKSWSFSWGSANEKTTYGVVFPPRTPPTPPTVPPPSTVFNVGLRYDKGEFTSDRSKSQLAGVSLDARVDYHKPEARWTAGGDAEMFLYAIQKDPQGAPNVSRAAGWLGFQQFFGSLLLRETVGLTFRWIDFPGLLISANFQAPRFAFETAYKALSLKLAYSTTSSSGDYTEMNVGAAYALPVQWKARPKLGVSYNTLKANSSDIVVDGSWLAVEISTEF